jgi:hypothetical protein
MPFFEVSKVVQLKEVSSFLGFSNAVTEETEKEEAT